MKRIIFCTACMMAIFLFLFSGVAWGSENRALILVDEIPSGDSQSSPGTVENLLGHFGLPYDNEDVDTYSSGDMENYRVIFYMGSIWDHDLPVAFLDDVLTTDKRIVWINYNLWKLGWGDYQQAFEDRYHIRYDLTAGTSGFDQVQFESRSFDWLSDVFGEVEILDDSSVQTLAAVSDGASTYPYILQSGNFFYVADDSMASAGESSQYLVFCELMHDMVGIEHAEDHRALVRIEDVDPQEDPARIRAIADYLYSQNVPFSLGVIPRFEDPLGAWGTPVSMSLADRPDLVSALQYAESRGGTLVMHGYTHQYDSTPNPYSGVTGLDSEFYISQLDSYGNVAQISPVPEDSESWVQNRIDSGLEVFDAAGLDRPQIWETPHYVASALDRQVFAGNFSVSYERFENAFFPYPIDRSVYGAAVVPENLGYIDPGYLEPSQLINRADKELAVRDGIASFFFHPEEDIAYLMATVEGIKALGYTFVDVNSLISENSPVCSGNAPSLVLSLTNVFWADFQDYQSSILSAAYRIDNGGPYAADVRAVYSENTNAVAWLEPAPLAVDISEGASTRIALKYLVPPGVANFKSITYVNASDACGNSFDYPAPPPHN